MLKVELRALEQQDLVLEEKGWAQALGIELDPPLARVPLEIHCEVSKNGDMISAKGWVKGAMRLTCDRCLKEFDSPYKTFYEFHYRPQSGEGPKTEEDEQYPEDAVDVIYFDGDILDVGDQVRQTIVLSVPMRALCKEDCRGLCGGCGCDLNTETCRCSEPPPDARWAALKNWRG